MKTIIRYILLTALRDWLFAGLFFAIMLAFALAIFTGSTALTEQQNMSLVLFAGNCRIVLAIGFIVFICFYIRRSFDTKEIDSFLSKPISRLSFILCYWLSFMILIMLAMFPVIAIITLFFSVTLKGLFIWVISLLLELSIVCAFSLLSSIILNSSISSVLSTLGFYIISRLMGFFIFTIYDPNSLTHSGYFSNIMTILLKIISTLIPRLDLFAKTDWLIYGLGSILDLWLFLAQAIIFNLILLAMATFDIKRKQF